MSVHGVLAADAAELWPSIAHHIARALAVMDTGYSLDDLLEAVQQRDKQLWIVNDGQAAGITSVHKLPQWKKLIVEYLAGDCMAEWEDDWFGAMTAFASLQQCKYIEAHGRPGWVRIAQQRGDSAAAFSVLRKTI